MSLGDFETFPPECPSELTLDKLELGELASEESQQLRSHLDTCSDCASVLEARSARATSMRELNRDAMLRNILSAIQTPAAPIKTSLWSQLRNWFQVPAARNLSWAVAGIASVLLVLNFDLNSSKDNDGIRLKGTQKPQLNIYRERAGSVIEVMPNDVLKAGDRLRFGVRVKKASGQFMIVGVESSGERFAYYPTGEGHSLEMQTVDEAAALDATVELDESKGREGIYLVWCPEAFVLDSIQTSKDGEGLRLPKECESTGIEVLKE